jgi:hypothetical protein
MLSEDSPDCCQLSYGQGKIPSCTETGNSSPVYINGQGGVRKNNRDQSLYIMNRNGEGLMRRFGMVQRNNKDLVGVGKQSVPFVVVPRSPTVKPPP